MSEQTNQKKSGGMMASLQGQALILRVLVFSAFVVLIVAVLFLITAFLYFQNVGRITRTIPAAIPDAGVTVSEFVQLNDADSYPAAIAVAADGTVYSASYVTGEVWRILLSGTVQSIPDSAAQIGSVIGLDVDSSGRLYVLDRLDPLLLNGAIIWRIDGDTIEKVIEIPPQGRRFVGFPNDIAVDADGNIYVADVQYDVGLATGRILRIDFESGDIDEWWQMADSSPENPSAPTGLAYAAASNELIVTDTARNAIYRIPISDNPTAETIYTFSGLQQDSPGLNGVAVADDGTIYVSALNLNRIARLDNDALAYLAAGFRGGSDVAYDAVENRLFVNNWDQRWLLPVNFLIINRHIEPRLPFSIDMIDLQ
ncbi:MAG: SMP-30/gluconolactonase/LRE family protein [Anaerolineae bacterium]|nr:SMP-30/gluconolactonase/LRE family protein [Anaerolineae bacterium]